MGLRIRRVPVGRQHRNFAGGAANFRLRPSFPRRLHGRHRLHEGAPSFVEPPEVVLRLGVRDADPDKVARFGVELAPLITAGPPGVTGFAGGRPKPQEGMAYWPALLAREEVEDRIEVTVEEA